MIKKAIYSLLVKTKKFHLLPFYTKIFKSTKQKVASSLLQRGYLNLAYETIKDEPVLDKRIEFMYRVKNEGFFIPKKKRKFKNHNILLIAHNNIYYDLAGYSVRTHMIAKFLKKEGFNVYVITRPGYPWDLKQHKNKEYKEYVEIDGIKYHTLPDKALFKKASDLEYIKHYSNEIIKFAKKRNIGILHAFSNYLNGAAAAFAANELNLPFIYEVRGFWHFTRITLDKNFKHQGMFEYEHNMEKAVIEASDKTITISDALKELLISEGIAENKIKVIPNGVDLKRFKPLKKDEELIKKYSLNKFVVGFIGSITKYEGLDDLIKATKDLEVKVLIVGDGRELENLKKIASNNVIFSGRVDFREILRYYSVLDLCVFPRKKYEVCEYVPPLKILEAMAVKKAVIASDVRALKEIVKDKKTGLLFKSEDINDLKEKILLLKNNKTLKTTLEQNAYNWVQNRSWEKVIKEYIEIYESLR